MKTYLIAWEQEIHFLALVKSENRAGAIAQVKALRSDLDIVSNVIDGPAKRVKVIEQQPAGEGDAT